MCSVPSRPPCCAPVMTSPPLWLTATPLPSGHWLPLPVPRGRRSWTSCWRLVSLSLAAAGRLLRRAALVGFDAAFEYHVLVIRPEVESDATGDLVQDLDRRLARDPARRPHLVAARGTDVVAIAAAPWRDGIAFGEQAAGLGPDVRWWATVAGPVPLDRLPSAYADAVDGLRVVPGLAVPGQVVPMAHIALERAMVADPTLAAAGATRWLGPLETAGRGGPELVRTLEAWLDMGGAVVATARSLGVAPRTVSYRLARMADILGVDDARCGGPCPPVRCIAGAPPARLLPRQRDRGRPASIGSMSELRPSSPIRRPEDARPRSADQHEHADPVAVTPPPSVDRPTPEELVRIQRHMASLPVHVGATVAQDPALGVLMIRQRGSGSAINYAAMPRWEGGTWQTSLDRLANVMRAEGNWPSLLLADRFDRPPGLDTAMASVGWRRLLGETVLWVGHASVVPHLDPRLRFEAVQPRSVEDHEALEREIFGVDPARAEARRRELREALTTGGLRAFVVRLDGEPIAVARVSQGEGVAGIYALGVTRAWRGKGYGTLLATITTRAGMATGNRIVWLSVEDGNDPARRVYDRLGFQSAFGWSRWLSPPD